MEEVARWGATLLPVDSEHNAVWQCFDPMRRQAIERIILTASGGPFRERSRAEMRQVSPEQAIAHPNWRMGAKISVDSATMMNKGLEVIEAHHLFRLPHERVEVVVHPQSIVHGLVAYRDGSVLAQLGPPDMRTPIAYALAWPERIAAPTKRLDLAAIGRLSFEPPDEGRFPALRIARDALIRGGSCPTVLNAANETAVGAFLEGRIGFLDIAETVERTLEAIPSGKLELSRQRLQIRRDGAASRRRIDGRRGACAQPRGDGTGMINLQSLETLGHGVLNYVGWFLVILTLLVFVHEFGHYFVARWNGVRVEVFSIGFGPELFGRRDRAGTRWKFSAIPLGGYIKMLGDGNAASALPGPPLAPTDAVGYVQWQELGSADRDRRRRAGCELRVRGDRSRRFVHDLRSAVHAGGRRSGAAP